MSQYNDQELFAMNEPDSENLAHSDDYIHVHSCGIMPEIMLEAYSYFRVEGSPDYMLHFISDGCMEYNMGSDFNEKMRMGRNSVILFKPGEPQMYSRLSEIATFYWVHFLGCGVTALLQELKLDNHRFFSVRKQQQIKQLLLNLLKATQSYASYKEIKCNSLLIDLLLEISKQNDSNRYKNEADLDHRLAPAMEHMLIHYSNKLSIDDMAALCHMSKYHFIRLFKEHTGLSPYNYLMQLRIKNARDLLEKSQIKIAYVAEAVGFSDPLYFSRAFKEQVGMAPAEYRRMIYRQQPVDPGERGARELSE